MMKETKKLKKTFNLIFTLIIALVFVTISGFVSELYEIHKKQKQIMLDSISESILTQKEEISEEFYIDMDSAISMRFDAILSKQLIKNYEIIKIKNGSCSNISKKAKCDSRYQTFMDFSSRDTVTLNVNDFTLVIVPLNMFKKEFGKIIVKIPHSYTSVNRLKYIALNILPLLLIVFAWIFLYRFVENNVINPQIDKISDYESNKKVYETVKKVTHDLRAPIAVINQVADEMINSDDYGKLLKISSDRVNKIVNDFLEDSRKKNSEIVIVNLNDLLNNLITSFEYKYSDINFKINSSLKHNIYLNQSDQLLLERSVSNITVNAIESISSLGDVIIDVKPGRDNVLISIIDTGIGIKESDKVLIFRSGFTSKKEGNGIGLASTYKWLKSIGGNIEFESKYGIGSTFKLTLPCGFSL